MKIAGIILAATALLAGCGGGGGNPGECFGSASVCGGVSPGPGPGTPPAAQTATGLYEGTTGTGRSAYAVVLPNAQLWLLYGQATNPGVLSGFAHGSYTTSGTTITATGLTELGGETLAVSGASFAGTFATRQTLAGTTSGSVQLASVSTTYDTSFDTAGSLGAVAGTFSGTSTSVGNTNAGTVLTVAATGTVTGSTGTGCTFTGALSAGTNSVYALNLAFSGGACANAGGSTTGIAFLDGTRLQAATINGARNNGFLFSGVRQ